MYLIRSWDNWWRTQTKHFWLLKKSGRKSGSVLFRPPPQTSRWTTQSCGWTSPPSSVSTPTSRASSIVPLRWAADFTHSVFQGCSCHERELSASSKIGLPVEKCIISMVCLGFAGSSVPVRRGWRVDKNWNRGNPLHLRAKVSTHLRVPHPQSPRVSA